MNDTEVQELASDVKRLYIEAREEARIQGEKLNEASRLSHEQWATKSTIAYDKRQSRSVLFALTGMWVFAALIWWFVIAFSGGCKFIEAITPSPVSPPTSGDAGVETWPTRCCYGLHPANVVSCEGALPGCTFQFTDLYTDDAGNTLGTCGNLICELDLH